MVGLGYDRYHVELEAETARLSVAVGAVSPQDRVPTCPEWTVRDLVTHVGTGHRWAAEIVEGRLLHPPPYVIVHAPQEPGEWVGWLTAGATAAGRGRAGSWAGAAGVDVAHGEDGRLLAP